MASHAREELPVPEPPALTLDPASDLVGLVLDVPDGLWGFENDSSTQHPGACTHYLPRRLSGILLKGTDADNVLPHLRWRYYFVGPDEGNGLDVQTAFECAPRYFRLHRLRLLLADRTRGRLSAEDLEALRRRLQVYAL